MFFDDLKLTIIPTYDLYTQSVGDDDIVSSEDTTGGRTAIILDLSNASINTAGQGLLAKDIGTIFSWPTNVGTILDLWQPSIIPLHEEIYERLSFNFLSTSLSGVGWQHIREVNLAFAATADLNLQFDFGAGAVPPALGVSVPNSGGLVTKQKILIPPNKWKTVQGYVFSTEKFRLWVNDMEIKCRSWGSADPYRIVKPFAS